MKFLENPHLNSPLILTRYLLLNLFTLSEYSKSSRTHLPYNWKFVPRDHLHPISLPLTPPSGNHQSDLFLWVCFHSTSFMGFLYVDGCFHCDTAFHCVIKHSSFICLLLDLWLVPVWDHMSNAARHLLCDLVPAWKECHMYVDIWEWHC